MKVHEFESQHFNELQFSEFYLVLSLARSELVLISVDLRAHPDKYEGRKAKQ